MESVSALFGDLLLSTLLVGRFFLLAQRAGVLAAFGRIAVSWPLITCVAIAAFVPASVCLANIVLIDLESLLAYPAVMAGSMSAMAVVGLVCLSALERFSLSFVEDRVKTDRPKHLLKDQHKDYALLGPNATGAAEVAGPAKENSSGKLEHREKTSS